jgi:hypothetical protein
VTATGNLAEMTGTVEVAAIEVAVVVEGEAAAGVARLENGIADGERKVAVVTAVAAMTIVAATTTR